MRSMPTTATATAVGAALRRRWEDRTPAGPVDAVLTEALLASLDVLLPGLGAAVRVEVLRGDIVRPDPARGPLNALLAVLADIYCSGNAGLACSESPALAAALGAGLVRRRPEEARWHLTPKGAGFAQLLWERPEPTPPWAQAVQVWPPTTMAEVAHA